jgi:beta-galactosidase
MIDQHYNHPAVILWGLANEIDWPGDFPDFDQNAIRTFLQELHNLAHRLDTTRLTAIRRCEFCKDVADVYSPSIWAGWYRGVYPEYEACTRAEFEKVPRFLHAEWGADNHVGRHTEKPYTGFKSVAQGQGAAEADGDYLLSGGQARVAKDGDWSETYFCDMIDWYLKSQSSMDWLTGSAQWAFKDFATPVRPDNPLPLVNQKGVVERDLTPKEAYYVFQSHWARPPMVHIYGHSWPIRCGKEGEKKTVRVYSNCPEAELFLNGQSCGKKQRNPHDFPAAGLRWEVTFRKGKNAIEARAVVDDKTIKDKIEIFFQTQRWGGPKKFKIKVRRQRGGRRLVSVRAIDKNGCLCADAAFFIRFSLAGAGRLIDNQGTVRGARRVQMSNGQACIYVEPQNGVSVVSVTAPGMRTIFRNIR